MLTERFDQLAGVARDDCIEPAAGPKRGGKVLEVVVFAYIALSEVNTDPFIRNQFLAIPRDLDPCAVRVRLRAGEVVLFSVGGGAIIPASFSGHGSKET